MFQSIRAVAHHRDLLFMITWRDIRIKYKQSVMGFLWAILMPMIIVAAVALLFGLGVPTVSRKVQILSRVLFPFWVNDHEVL